MKNETNNNGIKNKSCKQNSCTCKKNYTILQMLCRSKNHGDRKINMARCVFLEWRWETIADIDLLWVSHLFAPIVKLLTCRGRSNVLRFVYKHRRPFSGFPTRATRYSFCVSGNNIRNFTVKRLAHIIAAKNFTVTFGGKRTSHNGVDQTNLGEGCCRLQVYSTEHILILEQII